MCKLQNHPSPDTSTNLKYNLETEILLYFEIIFDHSGPGQDLASESLSQKTTIRPYGFHILLFLGIIAYVSLMV